MGRRGSKKWKKEIGTKNMEFCGEKTHKTPQGQAFPLKSNRYKHAMYSMQVTHTSRQGNFNNMIPSLTIPVPKVPISEKHHHDTNSQYIIRIFGKRTGLFPCFHDGSIHLNGSSWSILVGIHATTGWEIERTHGSWQRRWTLALKHDIAVVEEEL